ncbi:DoxX family protein [Gimesia sp.]|uniref:DoxX family protein n=1 Tax=Gimesia sp. TaxID=2024833 RepID=UPI0032EBE8B1
MLNYPSRLQLLGTTLFNLKLEKQVGKPHPQARTQMSQVKSISKFLLAIFMIVAGTMHFANPAFFLKIMPPYLPFHEELVLVSGVFEILLGALLLIPKYSRLAAWGIIALLIAVFPANIYLYQNQEILPASPTIHLLRLPLQGVFVLWAFWHTRSRTYASKVTDQDDS